MSSDLFFFLKDGELIRDFLFGFLPEKQRVKAQLAGQRSTAVLGATGAGRPLSQPSTGW